MPTESASNGRGAKVQKGIEVVVLIFAGTSREVEKGPKPKQNKTECNKVGRRNWLMQKEEGQSSNGAEGRE